MAGETVLIIDPQTDNLVFIREYVLEPNGYRAISLSSDDNAWDVISSQPVDLLIVDLSAPEMKDFSLLKQLRRQNKVLPVITTAARASTESVARAIRSGVNCHIAKPFTIEDMTVAINALLTEARLGREGEQLKSRLADTDRQLAAVETVLQTLLSVSRTIAASPDLGKELNCIVEAAARLSDAEESFIMLLDEQDNLYPRAAWGVEAQFSAGFKIKVKESLVGQVIRSGSPLIVRGRDEYEAFKLAKNYFVKSMANLPLKINGRIIGALIVNNRKSLKPFTKEHLVPLTILASFAGLAVEIGRLGDGKFKTPSDSDSGVKIFF